MGRIANGLSLGQRLVFIELSELAHECVPAGSDEAYDDEPKAFSVAATQWTHLALASPLEIESAA
ncbi:hypothetical protein HSB1_38530 [Halogranum salarium B-1]|uniref:Uncharacterized protein n=1 Tax=Halogranum salarium B-1 TaxID=1210908 RepID=J2ZXM2_9EURY|nr:hypothetical protein HSB1_38530 [Halogranum salarium B-1]